MPQTPLSGPRKGGAIAAPYLRALAAEFYGPIIPVVAGLRRQGLSLRAIAAELDRRGVRLRYHGPDSKWSATQVRRVLARAAEAERLAVTLIDVVAETEQAPAEGATTTSTTADTAAATECPEEDAEPPPRRPYFPPTTSDLRR